MLIKSRRNGLNCPFSFNSLYVSNLSTFVAVELPKFLLFGFYQFFEYLTRMWRFCLTIIWWFEHRTGYDFCLQYLHLPVSSSFRFVFKIKISESEFFEQTQKFYNMHITYVFSTLRCGVIHVKMEKYAASRTFFWRTSLLLP